MDSKLSRWCDGLIEAGWLAAIIVTPLFFNIHSDRVFEPDKLTLLRSIALVMVGGWLIKFIDQQGWHQRSRLSWRHEESIWKMPFILPISLLVIIYLISTLFSVTPSVSWAGSYQRLQGTYTTLSYIAIFLVTSMTMRTRAQVRRMATVAIIVSIPVSFYGVLQHFDLDPLPWGGNTQRRIAGHMGNAIFIGAYLIMVIPLVVARIIKSFTNILNDEELSYADVIRSSIYIFTLALQLLAIFWSQSRGPLVGILAGMFAFVLIVLVSLRNVSEDRRRFGLKDVGWAVLLILPVIAAFLLANTITVNFSPLISLAAFFLLIGFVIVVMFILVAMQKGWHWLWLSWILLAVVGAGWFILFNVPTEISEPYAEAPIVGGIFETYDAWRELPTIGRLGTVLEDDSRTGRVRVLIWEGALELLLPHEPLAYPDGSTDNFNFLRPFIGYGPESMYVAYNRFYPPELATIEARNASPDRSHNETFDALVITGILGFAVWQWLYLSVFYYGFKWLGVLRTKFDRNLLIILWIGVGLLVMAVFVAWRGPVYFGVALPFGSIGGLVLYLIYYALFAKVPEEKIRPFQWDRLLVTALIAAILAHFVEIHFGIAIASSRTHFFLYLAALFVLTYLMPRQVAAADLPPAEGDTKKRKGRKRKSKSPAPAPAPAFGLWGPLLLSAFMLALIIGTMGYTYITYNQAPDVTSVEQITPGAIFYQSMLINSKQEFAESPFIYLMYMLTWVLGILLIVSEMIKDRELRFNLNVSALAPNRRTGGAIILGVMGVTSFTWRLLFPLPATAGATTLLGQSLFWLWGALCLVAAILLFRGGKSGAGRLVAGTVALAGILFGIPLILAGAWTASLVIGGVCAVVLYLVWESSWNNSLGAVGFLAIVSLGTGLSYTYLQALQLRRTILYTVFNQPPEAQELLGEFLIGEAEQAASMLVVYYLFVFSMMIISAFALGFSRRPAVRENGSVPAYAFLAAMIVVVGLAVYFTNAQVIQADIIYKRGKVYDTQATRAQDPNSWDNAIAIYNAAIDRATREDFYYLFLGRAFLELATLMTNTDTADASLLLDEASQRLQEAQDINPLNTDHTANLARLNTRWVSLAQGDIERDTRLSDAEAYYLEAISLSPQNSIIRNEYAALVINVRQECERGLEIYRESLEIDPFYQDTYLRLAEALLACGNNESEETRDTMYREAAVNLEEGLVLNERNARAWLRLAQVYQTLMQYDDAVASYEKVKQYDQNGRVAPVWNIDFIIAQTYQEMGDEDQALAFAQRALTAAPTESAGQIQQYINQLQGDTASPNNGPTVAYDFNGPRPLAEVPLPQRAGYFSEYPPFILDPAAQYEAVITTENGPMRFRLLAREAPLTVNNFAYLAAEGFYDGVTFHRVLEDFMAQAGDPTGSGSGGPGYSFGDEVNNELSFDQPGLLAMANAGPNTNGSQFFITFVPTPGLDGRHTIFGEIVEGEDVLNSITFRDPQQNPDFTGDIIEKIDIIELIQ